MIIDLPSTTSSAINKKMIDLREKGGANTQGRVLTMVIITDEQSGEDPIEAANGASFEHPCRVIVVARGIRRGVARMDAQIRVGGDAGASEVIVLRLYGQLADRGASVVVPLLLPDAPVVAWWPGASPDVPADDEIGALAQRRITDAASARRPAASLAQRVESYRPGDTDLAWTRLTTWRGLLAAALDQPPHEKVVSVSVSGAADSASAELLAGWLALQLRCPVRRIKVDRSGTGLRSVVLERRSGQISLVRPEGKTATLSVTNQPQRQISLPRRGLRDCIAEELRRLDADDVYADVLAKGLRLVAKQAEARVSAGAAAPAKEGSAKDAPAKRAGAKEGSAKDAPAKRAGAKAAAAKNSSAKAAKPAATRPAKRASAPAAETPPAPAATRTRAKRAPAPASPATTAQRGTAKAPPTAKRATTAKASAARPARSASATHAPARTADSAATSEATPARVRRTRSATS